MFICVQVDFRITGMTQIEIKVISFAVEQHVQCSYDYLTINGAK